MPLQKRVQTTLLWLTVILLGTARTAAQSPVRVEYMLWEDFLEQWVEEYGEEEDTEAAIQELEEFHAVPLNINAATRDDLLALPVLNEALTDSLLAYRERKGGYLLSLGELLFVSGWEHADRCRASLFLQVGPRPQSPFSGNQESIWKAGHHELLTRFSLPFPQQAGDLAHTAAEAEAAPNKYFEGYRLANTTRYQYCYGSRLRYGLNLQKDSGEPFGTRGTGTYPFDYNSLYLYYRTRSERLEISVGDYRIRIGQGLLVGVASAPSRSAMLHRMSASSVRIAPHTSTDEYRFFRGFAASLVQPLGHFQSRFTAFASIRRLDGTLRGDTITAFKTDGLHRTLTELRSRHTVNNLTGGFRAALERSHWQVGLSGVWSHYTHPVWPAERVYNIYYLRGSNAAGLSVDYNYSHRRWCVQGELAFDREGHPATTHTLSWRRGGHWSWMLQGRAFSPKFVSPWGNAVSQGSHMQNEYALLAGSTWQMKRAQMEGYLEWFRHPRPIYRVDQASQGVEAHLQASLPLKGVHGLLFRYRLKVAERNVTGFAVQQRIGTHRAKAQWSANWKALTLNVSADGTMFASQTDRARWGGMLSVRAVSRLQADWRLSGAVSIFAVETYDARVYSYQPHLQRVSGSASYANKGMSASFVAEWKVCQWAAVGLQYNILHYFDRSTVGSGLTANNGSTRQNLHLQLQLRY